MEAFGDYPPEFKTEENSAISIIPVPYDGTSTWKKGSISGPKAICSASRELEWYDCQSDNEVYLKGIFTSAPVSADDNPKAWVRATQVAVSQAINKKKFPVVLGGEHSISYGSVLAHLEKCPYLTVLQFDAHADLRASYHGSVYNHACVMSNIIEHCPIVQIGIRSIDKSEKKKMNPDRVFWAHDLQAHTFPIQSILNKLSDKVYITFDLDAFDPSIMPAVGTPVPGGLLWNPTLRLLEAVCKNRTVVGFDVVELCPQNNLFAADFLAAQLVYKILSFCFPSSLP